MRIRQVILFVFLFSVKLQLLAQNISGLVRDENHKDLPMVNILIKEEEDSEKILLFTRTDHNGRFNIELKDIIHNGNDTIYLEASINGYNEVVKAVGLNERNKNDIIFTLYKQEAQELKEVIVVGRSPKFKISKDTV